MKVEQFFTQHVYNSAITAQRSSAYIFGFVSIGLARKSKEHEEILQIYKEAIQAGGTNNGGFLEGHPILKAGSIELELIAHKIFFLLQLGETHRKIKLKMDEFIKKSFPTVYSAARMQDRGILKKHYESMEVRRRKLESRFDAAIYLFLTVHDFYEKVDQQSLLSILYDIEDYEMQQEEYHKKREDKLLAQSRDAFGCDGIWKRRNKEIDAILAFYGMETSLMFHEERGHLPEMLLALDIDIQKFVDLEAQVDHMNGVFFHELLIKYQEMRALVVRKEQINREDEIRQEYEKKLAILEEEKNRLELEKKRLSEENYVIKERIKGMDTLYKREVDLVKKQYQARISDQEKTLSRNSFFEWMQYEF